jgi:AcrR family transcriptional regulator
VSPTREERKEAITKQRKQQILDAALATFSKKGFAEATTAEIARTAGIAEGTIYKYFPSKRELMVAVIKTFALTEPLLSLFDHAGETDFPAFFTAVLENRMNLIEGSKKGEPLLLMGELLRDPELKEIFNRQVIRPIITTMEKFYGSGVTAGYFRPLDTTIITQAMGGLVIGLLILNLLEGESSPLKGIPRQKLATEIVELVLKGIQRD